MARTVASWGMLLGAPLLGSCGGSLPGPAGSSVSGASSGEPSSGDVSSSVCRFQPGAPFEPQPDGTRFVPPRAHLISYDGRVDCGAPGGPRLGFVGASLRVRFVGTGLDALLKDFGRGTPQATNYYDVSIDGGAPRVLEISPARERYELCAGLPEGEHTAALFKRGEASPAGAQGAGVTQVLGFLLRGSELRPVPRPARRLEFVGDSITCGYGNELSTLSPDLEHYSSRRSNGHLAYGALTAAQLDARYSAVAASGRGVSRNYGDAAGALVPELYLQSIPEDPSAAPWEPSQYVPDAVVINLGTNDYNTPGVNRAEFVQRYAALLSRLRGYHPEALLVAALGPMLNDAFPPDAWTHARADLEAAVEARSRAGERNLRLVFFEPQTAPYGEDWHPTAATHAKMAEHLTPLLRGWLGW